MRPIYASACALIDQPLDGALATVRELGYDGIELFTEWTASALDWRGDPAPIRRMAADAGVKLVSLHLPADALTAARFAADLGLEFVVPHAGTMDEMVWMCEALLADDLPLTVAIEIHRKSPIRDLETLEEALCRVGDPRLKAVLETGHLHRAGQSWREALKRLPGAFPVVHLKDQVGSRCVPFGEGEIDVAGLMETVVDLPIVVEVLADSAEESLSQLAHAQCYLRRFEP